jgi:beta-glucosidase
VISERISLAGLVVHPVAAPDEQLITDAARAARDAEPAVVVVGLTAEQETEAVDKTTLALPGRQDDLVRAVAAAARRTVVVINSATPVLMPWLDQVDAVLWIGLPGQEGGDAVADVLLGKAEPTGRLVTTFPVADGDGPAWNLTPHDGALDYAEGTQVGYRGWYGSSVEPAFWFGAGLGWGVWDYRSAEQVRDGDGESVTVVLANTAERTSREVVQVYWRPEGLLRYGSWVMRSPTKLCPARSVGSHSLVIRAPSGSGTKPSLTGMPHRAARSSSLEVSVTSAWRFPAPELTPHRLL